MIEKPEKSLNGFTLKNIINIEEWQKIQDDFALATGICLRTLDPEGSLITKASNEPKLCSKMLIDPYIKRQACDSCLPTFLGGRAVVDRNLSFLCLAGLSNFVTPLRYENSHALGYLLLGPIVLVARNPKEQYRKTAEELSLSLDDFWKLFLEIKVLSVQGAKSLVELIKNISEYSIKLAFENKMKVEQALQGLDLPRLNKILGILLDVAFEISKADIGSMMVLDQKQENLTINSSHGIPEEIADRASVRLGEGISGIAAKEGKSYLINDRLKDNRIKSYLARPYLGSSMIIPLRAEDKLLGVLNLGALKTSAVQFNADSLKVMNKLTRLVSASISPTD
jgi:ligand-binding sensor protein